LASACLISVALRRLYVELCARASAVALIQVRAPQDTSGSKALASRTSSGRPLLCSHRTERGAVAAVRRLV